MTPEQLLKICPKVTNADTWAPLLTTVMDAGFIDTAQRQAAFIANAAHESGQFRNLEENLNYSAEALLRTFPKYFDTVQATNYARQPELIANRVYANRMGNGDEASGEGFKFRGRGIFQHTGKKNYAHISKLILGDDSLLAMPEMLLEPHHAAEAALVYWSDGNLNQWADESFDHVCDFINIGRRTAAVGDSNGYADRLAYYNRALTVLA